MKRRYLTYYERIEHSFPGNHKDEQLFSEWEMPWDEFAAQAAPFICIMPPQPPDDEIIIDWPMPDDQLIEDEVPCDVTAIDYCGNFIYENGKLKRILIPGGYVTFANNNINQPEYNCYLTDYQGNVRMVVDQSVNTKQIYHYYPYGGLMGGKEFPYSGIVNSIYGDLQPYKYNGKELDRHSGLDWYDYGARWYNGISWMTPDPHAENYYDVTPYGYCHNNPVNKFDPDGRDDYYTKDGKYLFRDQKETDNIIIRNQFLYDMKSITGAEWINPDTPIENMVLSAEAYSNIFTNILSHMENVDVGELHNGKVSVTVWEKSNDNLGMCTRSQYNDSGRSDETLAETGILKSNGERVVSLYMYPRGYEEKKILNTVANIQNLLGAHEFLGHYKNGWRDHSKVVPFQRKHETWNKTTEKFKKYNYEVYGK